MNKEKLEKLEKVATVEVLEKMASIIEKMAYDLYGYQPECDKEEFPESCIKFLYHRTNVKEDFRPTGLPTLSYEDFRKKLLSLYEKFPG